MRHELRHVRAFLKVAELQSFTRAAAELHVSQSALTVQVKQLEEELGVLLFDRNKRGVAITAAGRDLMGPLQRLVLDSEVIVGYARDISAVRTGHISLAALPTIAADLLPRAMHAFLQTNPEVRITVQDVVADRVRELVTKAAVDFGLGTASRQDRDVWAEPLYQDHLAAFVPASHNLAKRDEVTLKELEGCDLILPNRESSVRRIVEGAFARAHVNASVRHETNYMPTALALARRGLGGRDSAGVGLGRQSRARSPRDHPEAGDGPPNLPASESEPKPFSRGNKLCADASRGDWQPRCETLRVPNPLWEKR